MGTQKSGKRWRELLLLISAMLPVSVALLLANRVRLHGLQPWVDQCVCYVAWVALSLVFVFLWSRVLHGLGLLHDNELARFPFSFSLAQVDDVA